MWPWQIAIYRINKNVLQFSCGGVLVSRQWVLTAAHCFYDTWGLFIGNANLYLIKAGDFNLSVNETLQQEVVPKKIFVHPQFKPSGLPFYDGDIALVKLSQDVELSKFVRTVCLPEKIQGDLAVPKTRGTVAGWGVKRPLRRGQFAHLSEISKVLRHVSFAIQSDQLCINKSGIQFNTTTAFCAGDGSGGEDACKGDSGGAFVREIRNSKWVVVGVVSWGNGCAQKDQYGYYTRVHPFLDWINETMNEKKEPENNNPTNQCSSETVRQQRRRGINLNEDCGLDLVFLFDASVTVNKFHFQTSLEFANELLTIIGASKRSAKTRVAAVTETKLEFNLGDSKADTIDKAIKAIDNIMYVGWVSSYIRPFKLVRNKVAPNVRNDSHQVMMFITDGLDLSGSVRREAKNLRDNKQFDVYAIGVGRRVKTRALMSIASANEDHDHVISVRKYRNLREAVRRVVQMDVVLASCQSPGGIAHGKKFGSDYSHNKTVRYECDAEYTLEGKNRLTCNNGKWNYNPPQCKVVHCPDPGKLDNGAQVVNKGFVYGGSVTFTCDKDYTLRGKSTIYCQENKQWTASIPRCLAPCPDPGLPYQGNRIGDDFRHDKTVTFTCPRDYLMDGERIIRCSEGQWSKRKPSCKEFACKAVADVAFLVDSSGSIGRRNWPKMLQFLKDMVKAFNVGPDKTHIAIVAYSSRAVLEFKFDRLKGSQITEAGYNSLIDRILFQRGFTFIDKALILADEEVFQTSAGMRPELPQIAIVITDGQQTTDRGPYRQLTAASHGLKIKKVQVYTLGIGINIDQKQLEDIASSKDKVFFASTFAELKSVAQTIVQSSCPDGLS